MGTTTNQQYCLRWNNHRSNLLLVFEHLFHTEAFTDVTLACEGHSIKCHKMVLAACSSYFQQLFLENDCRHPIVILKDILFAEVKAILEYMYKGEVNVGQDQLSGLLKAAETLKVKGLVEDHQRAGGGGGGSSSPHSSTPYNSQSSAQHGGGSRSSQVPVVQPPPLPPSSSSSSQQQQQQQVDYENNVTPSYPKNNHLPPGSKFISTESPYSAVLPDRNSLPFHVWSSSKLTSASSSPIHHGGIQSISTTYDNSVESSSSFKRKKLYYTSSSGGNLNANQGKDTPILRTVLGHTSLPNSSEPQVKSLNYSLSGSGTPNSNGPNDINDKGLRESPDTYFDDSIRSVESDKMHEDNHSFSLDSEDNKQGVGGYGGGSNQKPEWKRYKQYTRTDITHAIDAVKAGMSALQAARKYGVPSRTLYDKVKKLGITTNRPYRKGSFPMSPYQGLNLKMEDASGYSPEEPLDVSSTGNGNILGQEGDSDKMDSDPGSSSIKQEHSPRIEDLEESPNYERTEDRSNQENDGKSSEMTSTASSTSAPRPQPPPPPFPTYLNGSYFGV